MAAKKNSGRGKSKGMTKTGFIRSMGPDVSPAEVIAKAKDQAIELTKKLVWTTQSEMRTAAKGDGKAAPKAKRSAKTAPSKSDEGATTASTGVPARKRKPGPKKGFRKAAAKAAAKTAAASVKATNGSTAEQKLKALVIELGTARADQVYRAVKSQLDAIVGGA